MTFVLVVDARAGGVLTHEGRGKSFEHSFDLRRFAWEAECERVGPQGCEHVPALELVEVAWKLRGERLAKLVVVPEAGAEELRAKRVAALVTVATSAAVIPRRSASATSVFGVVHARSSRPPAAVSSPTQGFTTPSPIAVLCGSLWATSEGLARIASRGAVVA